MRRHRRLEGRAPVLRIVFVFCCAASFGVAGYAQQRGEAAAAERYAAWALDAISRNRWGEAEEALERAADYADVSSDLSYLLATARFHQNRPQREILEALGRALEANRWNRYRPEAARLLEATCLIRLHAYSEALQSLVRAGENADAACLRLTALRFLPDRARFQDMMTQTLARYPDNPRPVEILFAYAADKLPQGNDAALIDIALKRLPFLLDSEPSLAYKAAPFLRNSTDARRYITAYRAMGGNAPEAISAALRLGVIGEDDALEELFALPPIAAGSESTEPVLTRSLVESVWSLLRNDAGRDRFSRNLSRFSGVITEDRDGDGYPESETRYRDGLIQSYASDFDQDGVWDLQIAFSGGFPVRGEMAVSTETGSGRAAASLSWEQYPALFRVELEGVAYIPRPKDFSFAPIRFSSLTGEGPAALLFVDADTYFPRLTKRALIASAYMVERPGGDFKGAVERIEVNRSIPLRASEWLDSQLVSVTEFISGRPSVQRLDLDLDGRMETVRRFRTARTDSGDAEFFLLENVVSSGAAAIESSESDWDGDGIYEIREVYAPDGTITRSWDMDRDGIQEFTEIEWGD
ncbi:MAG: hypothetical protein LBG76_10875 [Treponema sp.]|nr:hypothetical protein [Treponema sp.]